MSADKLTWYIARSGGIVAWCLLALALVWGLLLSSRVLGRRSGPAWLLAVHRHLGGSAVVFTVVHVVAIMLDDFVDFGFVDVLVPMASEWRPGAVAWGIVGMYLLVAIQGTSMAMRWLPKKLWRGVHWLSAGLFVVATIHGWQAGTDTGRAFMAATVGVIVVLTLLTIVRVVAAQRSETDGAQSDRAALLAQLRAGTAPAPSAPTITTATAVATNEPATEPLDLGDVVPTPAARSLPPGPGVLPLPESERLLATVAATAAVAKRIEGGDDRRQRRAADWLNELESLPEDEVVGVGAAPREAGPVDGVWKRRS